MMCIVELTGLNFKHMHPPLKKQNFVQPKTFMGDKAFIKKKIDQITNKTNNFICSQPYAQAQQQNQKNKIG